MYPSESYWFPRDAFWADEATATLGVEASDLSLPVGHDVPQEVAVRYPDGRLQTFRYDSTDWNTTTHDIEGWRYVATDPVEHYQALLIIND